jgi:hypothetical protein
MDIQFDLAKYDQLIDIALDVKDFKWVEQLVHEKKILLKKEGVTIPEFEYATAVEDIDMYYAVLEEEGLRNINIDSDYDLCYGTIVALMQSFTHQGETVAYQVLEDTDVCYLMGYLRGAKETAEQLLQPQPKKPWWKFWQKK